MEGCHEGLDAEFRMWRCKARILCDLRGFEAAIRGPAWLEMGQ